MPNKVLIYPKFTPSVLNVPVYIFINLWVDISRSCDANNFDVPSTKLTFVVDSDIDRLPNPDNAKRDKGVDIILLIPDVSDKFNIFSDYEVNCI